MPLLKSCTLHWPHCALHNSQDHLGHLKARAYSSLPFRRFISFAPQVIDGVALVRMVARAKLKRARR